MFAHRTGKMAWLSTVGAGRMMQRCGNEIDSATD